MKRHINTKNIFYLPKTIDRAIKEVLLLLQNIEITEVFQLPKRKETGTKTGGEGVKQE